MSFNLHGLRRLLVAAEKRTESRAYSAILNKELMELSCTNIHDLNDIVSWIIDKDI